MVGVCNSPRRNRPHSRFPVQEPEEEPSPGFRLWSSGPNFDTELPQDVTGLVGQTAYLTCRVFERTNKTVKSCGDWTNVIMVLQISWIRHSDLHILTVGRYTYTADSRYQSIYNPTSDEWILQVSYKICFHNTAFSVVIEIHQYATFSRWKYFIFTLHSTYMAATLP